MKILKTVLLPLLFILFTENLSTAQIQPGLEYSVYFLSGQSNASGRGDAAVLPGIENGFYDGVQTDVQFFWRSTLDTSIGNLTQDQFVPLQVDAGEGRNFPSSHATEFGPEISLGRTLADAFPDRNIAIIKYAHGGSNLHTDWDTSGDRYTTFLSVVSDALDEITASGATYSLEGFAWIQGEADTSAANSANYATNLTDLISRVRTDVFGGEQAQMVVSRLSVNQYTSLSTGIETVRAAQVSVADNDSAVEWVDTDGAEFSTYNIATPIHFDTQGVIEIGKSIGSVFVNAATPLDPDSGSPSGAVIFEADPGELSGTSNVNLISNTDASPTVTGEAGNFTVTRAGGNTTSQGVASQQNINELLGRSLTDADTVTMTFVIESTGNLGFNGIELGLTPDGTSFRPAGNLMFAIDADGNNSGPSLGNALEISNRELGFGIVEDTLRDGFSLTLTADVNGYSFDIQDIETTEAPAQPSAQFRGTFEAGQFLSLFSTGHIHGVVQQGTPTVYSAFNIAVDDGSGGGGLTGDFNGDNVVDCDDLNEYVGNLGSAATGALEQLDLTGDDMVTIDDANLHVTTLVQTPNAVGTFPGDLNCDGTANVLGDAFILVASLGTEVSAYTEGDINFDGQVNVLGDAFILVANLGMSNAAP